MKKIINIYHLLRMNTDIINEMNKWIEEWILPMKDELSYEGWNEWIEE